MNKKALGFKTTGLLTIGLIILVFVILFVIKARSSILSIVEDSECKDSIAAHALLVKTTGGAIVPDINCPTKYYTLSRRDEEETKKYFADAMKACWGTWGRGELQLFREGGYYCHICYVIDFKDKSKQIKGLKEYLARTPITPRSKLTYLDYLAGHASEKADPALINEILAKSFSDTINTSQSYAIMFVYVKGEKYIKEFFEDMDALGLGATGGGITTGFFLGGLGAVGLAATGVATGGAALVMTGVATVAGGVLGYRSADDIDWLAVILPVVYDAPALKRIGCEISPAKQEESKD